MHFPEINFNDVNEEDFLIIRYVPFYEEKGIVATVITEVGNDFIGYQNLQMGVVGYIDEETRQSIIERDDRCDSLLVGLPKEFDQPLLHALVYSVGAVYIPKGKRSLLERLSQNPEFQESLTHLDSHDQPMSEEKLRRLASF